MSEKFTIRRLEVGETTNPDTDFKIFAGTKIMPPDATYLTLGQWPHYRISIKPAAPEQPEAGTGVDAKPNPGEGWRLMKQDEIVLSGDEYIYWANGSGGDWITPYYEGEVRVRDLGQGYCRRRIVPESVESALVVDLREHELGELRKANETLLAENNRHELAWSDCSKKMDEIDRENDDLKRANAELLERCEQLTAAKNYRIELMGLEEVIDERDKLRAELAWLIQRLNAVLVLESETNRERDELKAQLATLKATAANEGQEAKWESDWSKLPSERCYGWTWGESYGRHSVWFTDFNYSPEAPGIFKHHVQMPQGHWCSMGGKPKLFCLAKPPAVPVDPPATEPQDDWRELSKGDTYSGPGQVRYGDDQDWEDADIIYIDNVTKSQMYFIACKPAREALFYSQARVREEKGGNQ